MESLKRAEQILDFKYSFYFVTSGTSSETDRRGKAAKTRRIMNRVRVEVECASSRAQHSGVRQRTAGKYWKCSLSTSEQH